MGFTGITIINGQKADSKAGIRLDQGVNFGKGVFETIDVVGKSPVFLEKHCERMKRGLAALGVANSASEELLLGYIRDFSIEDCGMKVLVTPENLVVTTRENVYATGQYKDGLKVGISRLKRNPHSHVVYHKTLNYTDNILENEAAHKAGFDEVIFANVYDRLAEGSVSNIFFASEGRVFTPAVRCGILDGIVRGWVLDNFIVEEGEFTLTQLLTAEEVFLTNSLIGVMPVRRIQDKPYTCPGKKCSVIQKAYREAMGREVEKYTACL